MRLFRKFPKYAHLAKNQQILMEKAFIFVNKNPVTSKLPPIDSK